MSRKPEIVVLCGGTSSEREVSLVSGHAVAEALQASQLGPVRLIIVDEDRIPEGLDPDSMVVFPVFHGTFGEDGGFQSLLDEAGFEYAGSGVTGSRISFDKEATKINARALNVPVIADFVFDAESLPSHRDLVETLGESLVIKPVCQGSSVGLYMVDDIESLQNVLDQISGGRWLVEKKIIGRELTVGLLEGRALGIVEIIPDSGVYDYQHKYTAGLTRYEFPAKLPDTTAGRIKRFAEQVFIKNQVRDFARADFILSPDGEFYFLEINTIPGLTATSLLPKSAFCEGYDFVRLVEALLNPAIDRFTRRNVTTH